MQSRVLRTIRWISFALIILLAGFYAGSYFWTIERKPAPAAARLDASPAVDRLPEFVLADLNGDVRSIADWKDRPLLINFWATWCAPCRREMPMLETLHQERRNDPLTIIGIAIDRVDDVAAFVPESGVTYPVLVGQSDAMDLAYLIDPDFTAMPFTVFTAPGGRILTVFTGELHPGQLRAILRISDDVAAGRTAVDEARRQLADLALRD